MSLADLKVGERLVNYPALVTESGVRSDKNGKRFLAAKLQDKSGTMAAKYFDWDSDSPIAPATLINLFGHVQEYNNTRSIVMDKIDIGPPDVNLSDFLPTSKQNPDRMMDRLQAIISMHTHDPIRELLRNFIAKYKEPLKMAPAATKYHHAYVSGLLEHIVSLCEAAIQLSYHYKQFNLPIVLVGCVTHDAGKIHELRWDLPLEYTRTGSLISHMPISLMMVSPFVAKLDPILKEQILHVIASHHGSTEHGSPVEPRTLEALVFSALDSLDANMAAVMAAFAGPINPDGFTERVPSLGRAFFLPPKGAPVGS
jgi:3'-5' exoribonuclease